MLSAVILARFVCGVRVLLIPEIETTVVVIIVLMEVFVVPLRGCDVPFRNERYMIDFVDFFFPD